MTTRRSTISDVRPGATRKLSICYTCGEITCKLFSAPEIDPPGNTWVSFCLFFAFVEIVFLFLFFFRHLFENSNRYRRHIVEFDGWVSMGFLTLTSWSDANSSSTRVLTLVFARPFFMERSLISRGPIEMKKKERSYTRWDLSGALLFVCVCLRLSHKSSLCFEHFLTANGHLLNQLQM